MSAPAEPSLRTKTARYAQLRGIAFAGALGFCALAGVIAACSLTASPGDYAQGGGAGENDGSLGPPGEAGADADDPARGRRLLVFAGRRAPIIPDDRGTSIGEASVATIGADGTVGPFTALAAPPRAGAFEASFVADGRVFVTSAAVLMHGSVDEVLDTTAVGASPYDLLRADAGPQANAQFVVARPPSYLAIGGSEVIDGGTFWNGAVFSARVDLPGRSIADWVRVPDVAIAVRANPTVVLYKNFLYAVGGWDGVDFEAMSASVDVAPLSPAGVPGPFVAAEPMANAVTSQPHGVVNAVVATGSVGSAGQLFVVGGLLSLATFQQTDTVLSARIRESDGTLEPWVVGPPFPVPMNGGSAVFFEGRLYVLGGVARDLDAGQETLSDTIWALDVAADGTLGNAWRAVGKLPGARASLTAVIY